MCCICAMDSGVRAGKRELLNAQSGNRDGWGMAWHDGKKLFTAKGVTGFKKFWQAFRAVPDNARVIVHFRTATSGGVRADMCHPFQIPEGVVFHNGIIAGFGSAAESDTAHFAREILSVLPRDWWRDAALSTLVDRAIGYGKLAILTRDGAAVIVGESRGVWNEKKSVWWSNRDFERRVLPVVTMHDWDDGTDYGFSALELVKRNSDARAVPARMCFDCGKALDAGALEWYCEACRRAHDGQRAMLSDSSGM